MSISSGSQRGLGQMWSCGPERPAKTDYALDQRFSTGGPRSVPR